MLRINLLLKDDFLHHTIEYQPVPTYYICFFVCLSVLRTINKRVQLTLCVNRGMSDRGKNSGLQTRVDLAKFSPSPSPWRRLWTCNFFHAHWAAMEFCDR